MNHIPKQEMYIADALSRIQADNPEKQGSISKKKRKSMLTAHQTLPVSDLN